MIKSIQELLDFVLKIKDLWGNNTMPWFRGEPETKTPLLPKIYRIDDLKFKENQIVQRFRLMGPAYSAGILPPTFEHTDQWLYIMQHVGVPTRLLDWTEGLLQALYFSLQNKPSVLWMLDPMELNSLTISRQSNEIEFPISWNNQDSPAFRNIQAAFLQGIGSTNYPIAFIPTYIHPRMAVQRSTFTVHGSLPISICSIDGLSHLVKIDIDPMCNEKMISNLRLLGLSSRSLFPDLDGLGRDYLL